MKKNYKKIFLFLLFLIALVSLFRGIYNAYLRSHDFNYSPNMRKLKSDYPVDDDNSPIKIANYNAVGGSTVLYSGHFPRFRESDFKTKTTDNVAFDWPINYQELEPYYNLNDSIIGISGLSGDPV